MICATARAWLMLTAIAAATLTPPDDVLALGVLGAPEVPPPFADCVVDAKLRSPESWLFTSLGPLSGAPFAPATASDDVEDVVFAVKETAPSATRSRVVNARVRWSANVRASAAPMEVDPAAAPFAVVFAIALTDADALSEPSVVEEPDKTAASLQTDEIANAIAGVIDNPGPDAPACAVVVISFVEVAVRESAPVEASAEPAPTVAKVRTSTRFSATDAPMPRDDPPVVPALAVAAEVLAAVAPSETAPPPAVAPAPVRSEAVVVMFAIVRASDPATPTEPPPAPLVAVLAISLPVVLALSVRPVDDVVPELSAELVALAAVIATAAPTFAVPPPVAEPSAVADASPLSVDASVIPPPLAIETPAGIDANDDAFAMTIAIAAATLTEPLLVEADGVLAAPEPAPPLAVAVEFAKPRSPETWLSTLPLLFVSGAPAALAVAFAVAIDGPLAVKLTAPAALSDLPVVAIARWLANVSAIAAPTEAEPPAVTPEAVEPAVAVVLAVKDMSPLALWAGPGNTCAFAATLLIVIATVGAIETPPPLAPVVVFALAVLVAEAESERSSAPMIEPGVPSSAFVMTFRIWSATDAPTPTDDPPLVAAFAVAVEAVFDVAVSAASLSPVIVAVP
jgi:hypothetical protein